LEKTPFRIWILFSASIMRSLSFGVTFILSHRSPTSSFIKFGVDLNHLPFFLENFCRCSFIPDRSGIDTGLVQYSNLGVLSSDLAGCYLMVL
jgi:hypothetical protein